MDGHMKIINFSEAKKDFEKVLDQVAADTDYAIIKRRDAKDVIVMSMNQFDSLMETIHLLRNPVNIAHLAKSIEQYHSAKAK